MLCGCGRRSSNIAANDALPIPDPPFFLQAGHHQKATALKRISLHRGSDLGVAAAIALNIRSPSYSLRNFHDDCITAFPELSFYLIQGSRVSSGGCAEDEFKRTLGALFSFYWLMRIGIDGELGFCYGVDDDWQIRCPPVRTKRSGESHKCELQRLNFYLHAPWEKLRQLLQDCGCLSRFRWVCTARTCGEEIIFAQTGAQELELR